MPLRPRPPAPAVGARPRAGAYVARGAPIGAPPRQAALAALPPPPPAAAPTWLTPATVSTGVGRPALPPAPSGRATERSRSRDGEPGPRPRPSRSRDRRSARQQAWERFNSWVGEELWRLFRGLPEGLSDEAADDAIQESMPCDLMLLQQGHKWLVLIEADRSETFPTAEIIRLKHEEIKELWVGGIRRRNRLATIGLGNVMAYDSFTCGVWQAEEVVRARAGRCPWCPSDDDDDQW